MPRQWAIWNLVGPTFSMSSSNQETFLSPWVSSRKETGSKQTARISCFWNIWLVRGALVLSNSIDLGLFLPQLPGSQPASLLARLLLLQLTYLSYLSMLSSAVMTRLKVWQVSILICSPFIPSQSIFSPILKSTTKLCLRVLFRSFHLLLSSEISLTIIILLFLLSFL